MSKITQSMMNSIDYEVIGRKRRENYISIHNAIGNSNILNFGLEYDAIPMVYLYLTENTRLRQFLIENKVFVAKYWPNVDKWVDNTSLEWKFANQMVAIPIDQRYDKHDMDYIIRVIKKYNE